MSTADTIESGRSEPVFSMSPPTLAVLFAVFAVGTVYELYHHYSAINLSDAVMTGTFGDEVLTEEDCDMAIDAYRQLGFEASAWEMAAEAGVPGAAERAADLRARQASLKPILDACANAFGSSYRVD